jgi:hypothetical protein
MADIYFVSGSLKLPTYRAGVGILIPGAVSARAFICVCVRACGSTKHALPQSACLRHVLAAKQEHQQAGSHA